MIGETIYKFCKENAYTIEDKNENNKSLILFLRKDGRRFILKQLIASETEDITLKLTNEIESMKSIRETLSDDVRLPDVVEVNEKNHFYISEMIEGIMLNRYLDRIGSKSRELIGIHDKLFGWLRTVYASYMNKSDSLCNEDIFENGPYSKKVKQVFNDEKLVNELRILFKERRVPISRVHGDLVPWNIIIDRNDRLSVLDWGNSGFDYPALDLARYLLQLVKKMYPGCPKKDIINLYWKHFSHLYGHSIDTFKVALLYQYKYSMKILNSKSIGIKIGRAVNNLLNKVLILFSYKSILRQINSLYTK